MRIHLPFQSKLLSDAKKVFEGMEVNSSEQEYLIEIISVSVVYDHESHSALQYLLVNSEIVLKFFKRAKQI